MDKKERKPKKSKVSWFLLVARILTYLPFRLIFPVKIIGKKKLPNGRLIIAMNHKSGLDPLVIVSRFRPPIHFVAKTEFQANKLLGFFMGLTGCIFIRRGEPDFSATKRIIEVLKENKTIGLFPEGTRHYENDGQIAPLKTGAVYYALKEKAPIAPMVIDKRIKWFRRNVLYVGETFELSEYYDKPITAELLQEATDVLYSKMIEIRKKLDKYNEMRKKP